VWRRRENGGVNLTRRARALSHSTTMDIDLEDAPIAGSSTAEIKAPAAVRVDDEHPFDLDAYAANYSGTALPRA
jgi:hypothetical protein